MIYLIDDKIIRQEKYNWTKKEFAQYNNALTVIHSKLELDKTKERMFSTDDIILFHDSFFDNPGNKHEKNVVQIRQDLIDRTRKKATVVFFGGAVGSRTISGKYVSIPVNILYNNLEVFLNKYIEQGMNNSIEIRYLVFGDRFDIEEIAVLKEKIWRELYDHPNNGELNIKSELSLQLNQLLNITGGTMDFQQKFTVESFKFQLSKLIKKYING
ncbi:hypothetical protein AAHN97_26905 [Chitinophaga niabensis]|uniref:hypothetical protein n=1 Tax=Chitinophaga niabensis TaxID=536979 RepID=UPI0031BBC461